MAPIQGGLSGRQGPFCQQRSQPAPLSDHPDHLNQGFSVTEANGQAFILSGVTQPRSNSSMVSATMFRR